MGSVGGWGFLISPTEAYIFEPLTAGTLETLSLGVPTSYKRVMALTCGQLFRGESAS